MDLALTALQDLLIGLLGSAIAWLPIYFANRLLDQWLQQRPKRVLPKSVRLILPTEVNEFIALADEYRLRTGLNALMIGVGMGGGALSTGIVVLTAMHFGGQVPAYLLFEYIAANAFIAIGYLGLRRAHREYVSAVQAIIR